MPSKSVAGVRAAALLAGERGRAQQAADGGEVAELPRARVVAGDLARRTPSAASPSDVGRAEHAGVRRSWCAGGSSRSGTVVRVGRRDLDRTAADARRRPSSDRIAPVGLGPSTPRSIASTTRGPNTMPSSSEFDARRLAPITPLQLASPATHSPGSDDAPSRSARIPPQL